MQRILSVIAGVLVAATVSLSAQPPVATAAARKLAIRATAAIQGTAVNASNNALANTVVRVRDARLGRIVSKSLTDKLGAYTFQGLDPGNYIVEIVSNTQTTIAATSLISANAGETVTAVVKLPFSPSLLGAIFQQQAQAATSATSATSAATSSVSAATGFLPEAIPAVLPSGSPVTER